MIAMASLMAMAADMADAPPSIVVLKQDYQCELRRLVSNGSSYPATLHVQIDRDDTPTTERWFVHGERGIAGTAEPVPPPPLPISNADVSSFGWRTAKYGSVSMLMFMGEFPPRPGSPQRGRGSLFIKAAEVYRGECFSPTASYRKLTK